MYAVTSPEKNDTKISNFGLTVDCFLGHIFERQCRGLKFSLFNLTRHINEFHFRLATVVSSNPFNFVNAHCYEWVSSVKNVH